jgi:predicted nucleotidyltransferase
MEQTSASDIQRASASRPDIVSHTFLAALRKHGVVAASLFGSIARGEERPDSDIDLLVSFDQDASYGDRLLLSEELERLCGRRADIATNLHPAFAPYILPTLVPLPI